MLTFVSTTKPLSRHSHPRYTESRYRKRVSTTKPLSRHSHFFAAAALAAILHGVSTTKPLSRHSHGGSTGRSWPNWACLNYKAVEQA